MAIMNFAKNRIALILGGSIWNAGSNQYPTYMMIGTGSATVDVTSPILTTANDRQLNTSVSYPSSQKIKFQGDWNSVELSGLTISEFGMTGSGTGTTGSMWSKAVFGGVNFDGTNELRVLETWEII